MGHRSFANASGHDNTGAGKRANVSRHGLSARVIVCHGDLLDPVPGAIDLVVANLPYLPAAEATSYPDLELEPADAVYAAGDGLDPYRRLLAASAERLKANGAVIIQLHRRVLEASRDGIPDLAAEIERHAIPADRPSSFPQRAAA